MLLGAHFAAGRAKSKTRTQCNLASFENGIILPSEIYKVCFNQRESAKSKVKSYH